MMIMTMQSKVMGRFTLPRWLWGIGWVSTAAMAFAVVTMLATWGD
jgi:Mn2+/Fe2+ NRAMP family transporter